jgi:hypothetical protein
VYPFIEGAAATAPAISKSKSANAKERIEASFLFFQIPAEFSQDARFRK